MDEKKFIEFAKAVGKLKRIPRTGWKMNGVKNPESVADHSFRVALLGMLAADLEGLDTEKVMRMLLLHDIEESIMGDIPRHFKKNMNKKELNNKQAKAVKRILANLPKSIKDKYLSLWNEMEEGLTKESKLCKDLDRLEMMIQVSDYEKEDKTNRKRLAEFWKREDVNMPENAGLIMKIYEELRRERGLK